MTASIVNHLWQSTLFALLAALLVLALGNNAARVRYWVWFSASVKFLVPFSALSWLGSQLSWRVAPAAIDAPPVIITTLQGLAAPASPSPAVAAAASPVSFDFVTFGIAIWLLGCAAFAVRWLVSWRSIASEARAAKRLAMDVPLPVKASTGLHEPVVVGILRPVMLLPEGIAQRLTAEQMRAIVAHELCHARHHDNLTAAVHMIVEVLFWFHPLVWWIGARMVDERERACDEAVLASGNEPERYAEGILKVCEFYVESSIACAAGISGADLKQRIEAIMKNRIADKLNAPRRMLLTSIAAASLGAPIALGLAAGTNATADDKATPVFDSVAVTRAAPDAQQMMLMWNNGEFKVRNVSLRQVIAEAYGVQKSLVVGGPAWVDEARYDIEARSSGYIQSDDRAREHATNKSMVRGLLAKEFGLIAHTETQQPDTLVLRIDQGGHKLRSVTWDGTGNMGMKFEKDGVTGMKATMPILANYLAMKLGKPVSDQTGLSGRYDFELKSNMKAENLPGDLKEHLGLTLETQLVPAQVVVIDEVREPQNAALSASTSQGAGQ
jgi:uncharacterized protein (TIGR03435 family)